MTHRAVFSLLGVLLLVVLCLSVVTGSSVLAVADVLGVLTGSSDDDVVTTIVRDIRMPRALLVMVVGAGIAVSGAAIQGLFRNPLADPALIGVSSGAALFAAGFMVLDIQHPVLMLIGVPGAAFVGGLLATWLVLTVGRFGGSISTMLLAGIAINALAVAGVGLFSYFSSDAQLRSVAFWALGSFNGADWQGVLVALIIPVTTLLMLRDVSGLNAMTLGDEDAAHLGVRVSALRRRIVILTALTVGTGVALAGVIAFVGLVVPHLVRLMLGANHRLVLPGSALLGALLLLVADLLSRTLLAPAELPIGILTSLVGGPFFLYLIIEHRERMGI